MTGKHFYVGMNYHDGGAAIARSLIKRLEQETGDRCTSRWPYSKSHVLQGIRASIALTDMLDLAQADYVILVPLTGTARGVHVEMGAAYGLDKPVYLFRPDGLEGTAFDAFCLPMPTPWLNAIETEMALHRMRNQPPEDDPASLP